MKNFIVLYHANPDAWQPSEEVSKEDMEKSMGEWMAWAERCGDQLVDMGTPLGNGQSLHPDGTTSASTKNAMGYSVLKAEDMEGAKKLMEGHPHLAWRADCTIEIHETQEIPGM